MFFEFLGTYLMNTELDMKKLAEWLQFAEIIVEKAVITSKGLEAGTRQETTRLAVKPKIILENDILKYGNLMIPLYSRPMTVQLIRPFFETTDHFLSKEKILKKVYNYDQNSSYRIRQSHHQNLLKLISRSRKFLEEACQTANQGKNIEWFPFDKKQNCYRLYEITSPERFS